MAYIQGLTHWIAKALREIKLPDLGLATPAYRHLLKIEENLREDSEALFRTIQTENPFAAGARAELQAKLREIEAEVGSLAEANGAASTDEGAMRSRATPRRRRSVKKSLS
jgi:prephenate dehydrogenase